GASAEGRGRRGAGRLDRRLSRAAEPFRNHHPGVTPMTPLRPLSRRAFLSAAGVGLGSIALDALLARDLRGAERYRGLAGLPHHEPKAKRVIFLYMSGGPSHLETVDYKPQLDQLDGQPIPATCR